MTKTGWKWPLGTTRQCIPLLVAALFMGGCYPKSGPAPGPASPKGVAWASTHWPGATTESLAAGRDLFLANCNRCHDYPDVTDISEEQWPKIVDRMGNKADLAPPQRDLVLRFILTARSEQTAKP